MPMPTLWHLIVTSANVLVALPAAALTVALACNTKAAALAGLEHSSRNFGFSSRKSIGLSRRKGRGEAGHGDQESGGKAEEAHGGRFD